MARACLPERSFRMTFVDGTVPSMPDRMPSKRVLGTLFGSAAAALGLALPGAAPATTGIEVTVPIKVTLSDSGVVFKPAVGKLHPDTDTTYQVRVVNRSSAKRTFRLGYRSTKPLAHGATEDFYFTFHAVGTISWSAGNLQARGAKGVFDVKLAKTFTGG